MIDFKIDSSNGKLFSRLSKQHLSSPDKAIKYFNDFRSLTHQLFTTIHRQQLMARLFVVIATMAGIVATARMFSTYKLAPAVGGVISAVISLIIQKTIETKLEKQTSYLLTRLKVFNDEQNLFSQFCIKAKANKSAGVTFLFNNLDETGSIRNNLDKAKTIISDMDKKYGQHFKVSNRIEKHKYDISKYDVYSEYKYHKHILKHLKKIRVVLSHLSDEDPAILKMKSLVSAFFTGGIPSSQEGPQYVNLIKRDGQDYYTAEPWPNGTSST